MKAVVLAAGTGRRLWPLTENRPKPMIPAVNRPILEHVLEALEAASVDEVLLVVGANRQRVQSHFGNGREWAFDVSYVVQERQLGTGHALLQAEAVIGESFLALNGDRIIDPELIERVRDRHRETNEPVVSVTRVPEPSRYGVVDFDGTELRAIDEKPPPDRTTSEFINAGVYGFAPDVFAAIRNTETRGERALTDTLSELLADRRLQAVTYRGTWLDVSEPWDLLDMNDSLIAAGDSGRAGSATVDPTAAVAEATVVGDDVVIHPQAAVLRGVTLGDNVSVGPGAVVENAVLLSDVTLRAGAVVTDCIVGANTTVGPNTTVKGGATDVLLEDRVYHGVTFGGLLGDNVEIGANVAVQPGTVVGNGATVGDGTHVSGRIDDGAAIRRG
jgi:glucose-1-phosphate thymidylyltransferase